MTAATQLQQAGVRLRRQDVPAARLNAATEFYDLISKELAKNQKK